MLADELELPKLAIIGKPGNLIHDNLTCLARFNA